MSEIIKSDITEDKMKDKMKDARIATLEAQLSDAREEITRLERYIARKEGVIKGLAYAIRCNGVSGNEIGGFEE